MPPVQRSLEIQEHGIGRRRIPYFINPGRFGPIPVRSGRFGPNSRVSRFGPIEVGCFGQLSKVGLFGRILGVSRFSLIYLFGENR